MTTYTLSLAGASDRARLAHLKGYTVCLPRGCNYASHEYLTLTGRPRVVRGTYTEIARVLRRAGYRVVRSN